jgi:putative DNA primase/helicase
LMRADLAEFLASQLVVDNGKPVMYQPNTRRINDVLDALATLSQVRVDGIPAWLETTDRPKPENVIAFQNGLLNVQDYVTGNGRLMPPDPAWFSTNVLPFNFNPEPLPPSGWLRFIRELWESDAEAIALAQEFAGYTLSADTTQQKILLIAGPPRSGKGTFARILTRLVGPDNVASPTLTSLSNNFGLAPLIGKQLAIISDARLSGRTDQAIVVERLLSISGEDALTIDRKCRECVTLKLPTRIILLSNELPKLSDASGALAERFLILVLKRSFLGHEDTALTEKLSAELPGILVWALEGLRRLHQRGRFINPASGEQASDELRDLVSPVGAFVRERCIVAPGRNIAAQRLYDAWSAWCREQGREHPGTAQGFGRDLRAALPAVELKQSRIGNGDRVRTYEGIGINELPFG